MSRFIQKKWLCLWGFLLLNIQLDRIFQKVRICWNDGLGVLYFFLIMCDENYIMVDNGRSQVSPW